MAKKKAGGDFVAQNAMEKGSTGTSLFCVEKLSTGPDRRTRKSSTT